MDQSNLKDLLNDSQYQAVTCCNGASVIVAGAGSGKTRVLTYKIAYLLQNGYPAGSILALTFTNKAAREMTGRIDKIVGENLAKYIWMGTFHSLFLRILRYELDSTGFKPNFSIYDSADSKSLITSIIKEKKLDDKIYKPAAVAARISKMKNHLVTPANYRLQKDFTQDDFHRKQEYFSEIFATYCERCKEANAMDFDDILLHTFLLFKKNLHILEKYQRRFSYILVDEYQDTNIAQHQIINMLADYHKHICVVGDDAQSIYSFRGAQIDNILSFQKNYENCRIFKLEQNYRSTQNIVNTANGLISKNRHQIHKKVFSKQEIGEKIKVFSCFSDYDEAATVVKEIENAINQGIALSEIAILYRTNSQSRVLEDTLLKKFIPYKIFGGHSFYARKEIKDALAYMRLTINPLDEESFKRIINFPARGLGDVTVQKMLDSAHQKHIGAMDLIFHLADFSLNINAGTRAKLQKFGDLIFILITENQTHNAYDTAEMILKESGILAEYASLEDSENISRKENLQELLAAIHQFCEMKKATGEPDSLADFLTEVALITDQDTDKEGDNEKVTLMTIHSAKGLEFKNVHVVGLEEELFPSSMCEKEREIEEERRLFYVAITRAKERCTISYAKSRFRFGSTQYPAPSRFLEDLDKKFVEFPKVFNRFESNFSFENFENKNDKFEQKPFRFEMQTNDFSRPNPKPVKPSYTEIKSNFKPISQAKKECSTTKCNFAVGNRVHHQIFGNGTLLELFDNGEKAKINFDSQGVKTLLLKYSKLEKI
ncbi:MAG: UvrD-helicase domain-containing protein [Prevotellaceae bacterium]|jgi:DNA helicase-2/ATP-dependent DNA helicase PcrA|nr:UvrD-helicase domain-containing protein [Prevotellaceae bacterium]